MAAMTPAVFYGCNFDPQEFPPVNEMKWYIETGAGSGPRADELAADLKQIADELERCRMTRLWKMAVRALSKYNRDKVK